MNSSRILLFSSVSILLGISYHFKCEARDSIVGVTNPLIGSTGETLVSAGNRFELGFFTPHGIEEGIEYIGIWYYKMIPRTIVWVARRNSPLNDSSRVFGIAEDGNLKLWYSNGGTSFPVTDLEPWKSFNRTLLLLDSGNLIFLDGQSEMILWQSFDYPTDTFLPGMKMDDDMKLNSWLSPSDPSPGNYVFQKYESVYSIRNRSNVYWTSGEPGLPMMPSYIPSVVVQMLSHSETVLNQTNDQLLGNRRKQIPMTPNYTKRPFNPRLLMTSFGKIEYYVMDGVGGWSLRWSEPHSSCSVYNVCGKFAICNNKNKTICSCLPGYKPVSMGDWIAGKYSEGCGRDLTCKSIDNKVEQNKFLELKLMKVGGEFLSFNLAQNEDQCQKECLSNCHCHAYLYMEDNGTSREAGNAATTCWISKSDLVNLDYHGSLRFKFFIRGPFQDTDMVPEHAPANSDGSHKEVNENKTPMRSVIVFIILAIGLVLVLCCCYVLCRRRTTKGAENRGKIEEIPVLFICESEGRVNDLMDEKDKKGIDVPFYDFDAILSATNNFSDANKLGQGGFGPVYKGKFPGGQEIAVKRLSCCSGQGIKEFQNEVVLIAKLQHRNLVRLLGYCIKGNEKILLYEYMPNRSLDAFIFDQNNCLLLDWKKRFEIILGVARGLLYLHQDSRLRIIHRDLKTSNVLLDEDMNPKISDFGLARIIEGKGTEASTKQVVGTFGYMSPEYALEGKFSTKSDVFSFGVLVLEIVSGKRNTGFYQPQEVLTLLGYTWRLWSENKALDLADPTVVVLDSFNKSQVMKCIHVGLLCVQEDPGDRPSMSNVVVMLESETSPLQPPTQPAFVVRRRHSSTSSTSSSKPDTAISNNALTISMVQGR